MTICRYFALAVGAVCRFRQIHYVLYSLELGGIFLARFSEEG